MPALSLHREWPFVLLLAVSPLFGMALGSAFDLWGEDDEVVVTLALLLESSRAAIALGGGMWIFARLMRVRLWQPASAPDAAQECDIKPTPPAS